MGYGDTRVIRTAKKRPRIKCSIKFLRPNPEKGLAGRVMIVNQKSKSNIKLVTNSLGSFLVKADNLNKLLSLLTFLKVYQFELFKDVVAYHDIIVLSIIFIII